MSAFIYFFYPSDILHNLPTPPSLPRVCSQEDICLSGWKKSRLEAVCLDLLLPGSEPPAVWGGLFTLLTAQTVILARQSPRLCGYARRGGKTTWIKRSGIFTGTPTRLTVKCVFEGKWKGLPERFPIAETKAKPFLVFCDVEWISDSVAKAFAVGITYNGNYRRKTLCF